MNLQILVLRVGLGPGELRLMFNLFTSKFKPALLEHLGTSIGQLTVCGQLIYKWFSLIPAHHALHLHVHVLHACVHVHALIQNVARIKMV